MSAPTLPVIPEGVIEALPGADDDRDTGVAVRPVDPAAVLERLLDVLADRGDVRGEWFIAMRVGKSTRGAMARQVLRQEPLLLDVLTQFWSGPEARQIARRILDEAPGQCFRDRHCRLGDDHDGPCLPGGE